jgi:hypothetical protein
MSMDKIYHVLEKSQSKGSRRVLLLTVALHANDCCGVAWPSDETLQREANVSRQRIHELKQQTKGTGELGIIDRPGYTNLYFIADGGKPVGLTPQMLLDAERTHERGCPLRDHVQALRVAKRLFETPSPQPGEPADPLLDTASISPVLMEEFGIRHTMENWPPTRSGAAAPPVDNASDIREGVSDPPDPHVSDVPDPQGSEIPDLPCQKFLTQKRSENEMKKNNVVNGASDRTKSHLPPPLTEREEDLARDLAWKLDGDSYSLAALRRIVGSLGEAITYRLFKDTMEQEAAHQIKTTRGRYFTDLAKREAALQGIDLGFRQHGASSG